MSLVNDLERLDLLESVNKYGFCKGSEVYWLHKFRNLPEHQHKSRQQLEREIVEVLRIPKLSKSTFDKTFGMYKKIQSKLMSREVRDKIELLDK
jgi:hypothetical protein